MADCVTALKEWTGKARATIVYDSTVDDFTHDGLFDKIKGKSDIALVGFTTDRVVFGGFYSVAVTEREEWIDDPNILIFSFESHGRCVRPQRFVVKEGLEDNAYVRFKNNENGFVEFGVESYARFSLGNERSDSFCRDLTDAFEGLEDTTLVWKNWTLHKGPFHHYVRLVAVQLE